MVFYHGTQSKFETFRTPTGNEEWSSTNGGLVYLTSDVNVARKYAGNSGHVLTVYAPLARAYKDLLTEEGRSKASKYTRNVFVCLPSLCSVMDREMVRNLPAKETRKQRKQRKNK